MADPFLDALHAVRKPEDPFLAALTSVRDRSGDPRSGFAKTVDALNTPLLPQIETGSTAAAESFQHPDADDPVWLARVKGFAGGALEGAGRVLAGFTSPLGIATTAAGIGAPRAAAAGLTSTARALRGAEAASGAAFGARGLEQALDAETVPEVALGVAQTAAGVLGMRAGTQGFLRTSARPTAPSQAPRGFLPAGPRFIADDTGQIANLGDTIPMRQGPDGSFVRSVDAVPTEHAWEGRSLRPSAWSSDPNAAPTPAVELTPAETHALRWIDADLEHHPFTPRTFVEAGRGRGSDLEVSGGAAGSDAYAAIQEQGATGGTASVRQAIENLLEGKRTITGDAVLTFARDLAAGRPRAYRRMTLPPDAGGDLAGTAYEARQSAVRNAADTAADHAPPSRPDPDAAFRDLQDRVRRRALDREAAGPGPKVVDIRSRGMESSDEGFDRFMSAVDEVTVGRLEDPPTLGASMREPGQEGQIDPMLAARLGLGGAGAIYGAGTGEDTSDRVTRAMVFGAAGLAAPSLLARRPVGAALRTRTTIGASPDTPPSAIPPADPIPADRVRTMPTLTEDVQGAADDLLERYAGFEKQRRGVQSVARTEGLSDRIEVTPGQPVRPGTAFNAERLRAYQNATATILRKQQTLEQAVRGGKATPAQELELARVKNEATVLTASFRGAAAEAGRALHILRYQARILESGDTELMREAVQASRQGLAADVQAYYYSNILSGIATHERNILGNLSNAVYNLAAHPFAVGADVARSGTTGQPRQVFLGELPERVAGTVAAIPRAFSTFLQTLKTGIPSSDVTAFDRPVRTEFRGGGKNPFNYPGRALDSVDDFFATVAGNQTLYAAAFAQAKREGLSGPQLVARAAELKANPSEAILQEVQSQRARLLFREEPGQLAKAVLAAKRHVPALGYVLPFVRVPANIIRQGFEASPAGLAMPAARAGGRAGADAMGRAALGSLVLAPLAYWAALGKVTGDAPADPAKRAAFYESGKRPNSILIGDRWINYQPIQPLNVPLAMVANGFTVWSEAQQDSEATADQMVFDATLRTAGSLLDQSFLSGLSALVDALGDPERYGKRFIQQLATGFVPLSGALRTITHTQDPIVRAPQSVTQGIQAILPGQSETLQPRLTRFGETVPRDSVLNVFKPSRVIDDPVASALEAAGVNLRPAEGPKYATVSRGVSLPLAADERTTVGQASGRAVRAVLERVIATPAYQQASPIEQQRMLERAVSDARAAVREQVQREALSRLLQQSQAR